MGLGLTMNTEVQLGLPFASRLRTLEVVYIHGMTQDLIS